MRRVVVIVMDSVIIVNFLAFAGMVMRAVIPWRWQLRKILSCPICKLRLGNIDIIKDEGFKSSGMFWKNG